MNWMGGPRRRFFLDKEEKRKQKQFFESQKQKHHQLDASPVAQSGGGGSSSMSMVDFHIKNRLNDSAASSSSKKSLKNSAAADVSTPLSLDLFALKTVVDQSRSGIKSTKGREMYSCDIEKGGPPKRRWNLPVGPASKEAKTSYSDASLRIPKRSRAPIKAADISRVVDKNPPKQNHSAEDEEPLAKKTELNVIS